MSNGNTKGRTTIDLTPTWRATMSAYAMVLSIGDAEGQRIARDELLRIGDWMDAYKKVDWETILEYAQASSDEKVQSAVAVARGTVFDSDDDEVQS
jgi:hypothetical protein